MTPEDFKNFKAEKQIEIDEKVVTIDTLIAEITKLVANFDLKPSAKVALLMAIDAQIAIRGVE